MATIEEIVDGFKLADLQADPEPEPPVAPIIELPPAAVRWICKQIDKGRDNHAIAAAANTNLGQMGITVDHANPVKAKAHVARIRRAMMAKLAALQPPGPPE